MCSQQNAQKSSVLHFQFFQGFLNGIFLMITPKLTELLRPSLDKEEKFINSNLGPEMLFWLKKAKTVKYWSLGDSTSFFSEVFRKSIEIRCLIAPLLSLPTKHHGTLKTPASHWVQASANSCFLVFLSSTINLPLYYAYYSPIPTNIQECLWQPKLLHNRGRLHFWLSGHKFWPPLCRFALRKNVFFLRAPSLIDKLLFFCSFYTFLKNWVYGGDTGNKIIRVSGVQLHNTSSAPCIVCSPPQVSSCHHSPSSPLHPPPPSQSSSFKIFIPHISVLFSSLDLGLQFQSAIFKLHRDVFLKKLEMEGVFGSYRFKEMMGKMGLKNEVAVRLVSGLSFH